MFVPGVVFNDIDTGRFHKNNDSNQGKETSKKAEFTDGYTRLSNIFEQSVRSHIRKAPHVDQNNCKDAVVILNLLDNSLILYIFAFDLLKPSGP